MIILKNGISEGIIHNFDLNDTLFYIIQKTVESYPYALDNCPVFSDPKNLWNYLKMNTSFQSDGIGRELLQSMPTLFENNVHGESGKGDCDCFVITSMACMKRNGWNDIKIVLAGRSKNKPVHIYNKVKVNGKTYIFDLTAPYFNFAKDYPFTQEISV